MNTAAWCCFGLYVAFSVVCASPTLYKRVRHATRPWMIAHVKREGPFVAWVQAKFRSPSLDPIIQATSLCCSTEFYLTFMPFVIFAGYARAARLVTQLLLAALYVGNAGKDLFCSPRPPEPPVQRVGEAEKDEHKLEYGLPSTHTINTVTMCAYAAAYACGATAVSATADAGDAGAGAALLSAPVLGAVAAGVSIVFGRVYLGMHSALDIVAGLAVSAWLTYLWAHADAALEALFFGGSVWGPAVAFAVSVKMLWAYPRPIDVTPSYKYMVYFASTNFGLVLGVFLFPGLNVVSGPAPSITPVSLVTPSGLATAIARLVVALVVILSSRALFKLAATTAVVPLFRLLPNVAVADHDALRDRLPRRRRRSPSTTLLDADVQRGAAAAAAAAATASAATARTAAGAGARGLKPRADGPASATEPKPKAVFDGVLDVAAGPRRRGAGGSSPAADAEFRPVYDSDADEDAAAARVAGASGGRARELSEEVFEEEEIDMVLAQTLDSGLLTRYVTYLGVGLAVYGPAVWAVQMCGLA